MVDSDRRLSERIGIRQVVSIVLGNGGYEIAAVTQNVSSCGAFLYTAQFIPLGTEVGLVLKLPPRETEEWKRVLCFGKVLRLEKELKEEKFGTDVAFQRYEVLSEA